MFWQHASDIWVHGALELVFSCYGTLEIVLLLSLLLCYLGDEF